MFFVLLIVAVIARFATDYAHWKIALGLTLLTCLFASMINSSPSDAHLFFAILFSPAIFGICYFFLTILGWIKSRTMRPTFGREGQTRIGQ